MEMLELRAGRRAEETILDNVVGTYLSEFMKDVARETLRAGLMAKRRAEDEVRRHLHLTYILHMECLRRSECSGEQLLLL